MAWPPKITGYHAGKLDVLRLCATHDFDLTWSTKRREWLGYGVYFFAYSEAHARRWVDIGYRQNWWDDGEPAILQADIELRNCLFVQDIAGITELKKAGNEVLRICAAAGVNPPRNKNLVDEIPIEREFDCAVFEQVHHGRQLRGEPEIDTVLSYCADGVPVVPGATMLTNGHHQICVRNHECISNKRIIWHA